MKPVSRRGILQTSGVLLAAGSVGSSGSAAERTASPVRLAYNESPFGPSRRARDALLALGDGAWKYSYEEVPALRALIAEHEGVRPENVFVGEGSGEILKLAALIYGEPGRQVIASRPTFPMLLQYASRRGATITWVDVDAHFGHDLPAMRAAVGQATSLVYVCNPNNPTGALADHGELRSFIESVAPRALVVVDEAYIDYAPDPEQASAIDLVRAGANILVTRSFSKLYGLAGLRIGYGVAGVDTIRNLESQRISIPNQAGVAAARVSHGDRVFRAEIRRANADGVAYCTRLFESLNLRHAPTHANFMMFDSGQESTAFVEFARDRGVLVAPVYEPLSTWVRVSMGRPADLQAFARTLRAFIAHA